VISFILVVIGALAVVAGAIVRPLVRRWIDERNIERLRLRYSLDQATAEQLYRLARRDGFGSAWQTVIDGPADAAAQTGQVGRTQRTRRTGRTGRTRGSSVAGRHRA
jgi:hypothetical protein